MASENSEYADGEVVWTKLGPCWWPGEVWGPQRIPPGIAKSFRKPPIAVVKFFQEDTFEYVKNVNHIFKYDCSRKREFIKKGLDLHRQKLSHMEKFPQDVSTAETRTDGDPNIIDDEEFLPAKKESYAGLFASETPSPAKKLGAGKRGRPSAGNSAKWKAKSKSDAFNSRKITHPRIIQKNLSGTSDYKAHILVQPNEKDASFDDSDVADESPAPSRRSVEEPVPATPPASRSSQEVYSCHSCKFTTNRLNTLILHNKSHSAGFIPHTPVNKVKASILKTKSHSVSVVDSDDNFSTPLPGGKKRKVTLKVDAKPRGKPKNILDGVSSPLKIQNAEPQISPPKRKLGKAKDRDSKKPKSDVEIKNSLLADWNEDSYDESMDILSSLKLAENPVNSDKSSKDKSKVSDESVKNVSNSSPKAGSLIGKRGQASCFDFEEDEDLEIVNIGKKIPRLVGKPEEISKKSIDPNNDDSLSESKMENENKTSDTIPEDDVAKSQKEIADFDSAIDSLLKETSVPDLPALPSDSNFQKSNVVKIPDKEKNVENQPVKSIFKTKTFFRSRHSRSQDAIEKYVADNTSCDKPLTYMEESADAEKSNDLIDNITTPSETQITDEVVQSKIEPVRVTKFAPKIQLKKMSAALTKNKLNDSPMVEDGQNVKDDELFENRKSNQINERLAISELFNEGEKNKISSQEIKLLGNDDRKSEESAKHSSEIESNKEKSQLKILSKIIIKPPGREKILNFDVSAQSKLNTSPLKQKIIIRRTMKSTKNDNEACEQFVDRSQENLVLSSKGKWGDDDVQTFTIEDSGEQPEDLLDPKIKKVNKSIGQRFPVKGHNTIITSTGEIIQSCHASHQDYDINSMPVVLSDDIISPESTKNLITQKPGTTIKRNIEAPIKKSIILKSVEKSASPNILSKSTKKTTKHLLVVDKITGEKKLLVGHEDINDKVFQTSEGILNSKLALGSKSQKIVLNSTTKGHVITNTITEAELGALLSSSQGSKTKSSPAKVVQNKTETSSGNAIMIITNSQGGQSKVLLTPEHQKVLFPKNKVVPTAGSSPRATTSTTMAGRIKNIQTIVTSSQILNSDASSGMRAVSRQKSAILNSKGQLILSGNGNKRTILTTMPGQAILTSKGQLIAPQSSIVTSSSKLLGNAVKSNILLSPSNQSRQIKMTQKLPGKSQQEPGNVSKNAIVTSTILLKPPGGKLTTRDGSILRATSNLPPQKPGTVMHYLTAAEFEHFQKTGQIISSQGKVVAGKNTQKYILQKYVGTVGTKVSGEQIIDNSLMQSPSKIETVYSSDVPPLTPIQGSSSNELQSDDEYRHDISNNSMTAESNLEDSNYDNLDKFTSLINNRKGELAGNVELNKKDGTISANAKYQPHIDDSNAMMHQETLETGTESDKIEGVHSDSPASQVDTLADTQKQLLAVPGENFGGPPNSFFLCVEENGTLTPVDNQPLVLENNQLVPMTTTLPTETQLQTTDALPNPATESPKVVGDPQVTADSQQMLEVPVDPSQQHILINIGDQQILVDHQTLLSLVAGDGQQLVTNDGQQLVFQGSSQQILAALASNPEIASLLSEGQQILLNSGSDQTATNDGSQIGPSSGSEGFNFQTEVSSNVNQDILAAALAGTEVYPQDTMIHDTINIVTTVADTMLMDIDSLSPNLQNLNAAPAVHSNVFETSSTLNQPIMSPLELPTKKRNDEKNGTNLLSPQKNSQLTPKNLEDSLADIGVTSPNVPTSLELPITVTNPRIAVKTTSPLSLSCGSIYQSGILNSMVSPGSVELYESDPNNRTITDNTMSTDILHSEKESGTETITNDNVSLLSIDNEISTSKNLDNTEEILESNNIIKANVESKTNISSMPSLDEIGESNSNEVSQESAGEICTKVYSPISMPILTEETYDVSNSTNLDLQKNENHSTIITPEPMISETEKENIKSMPEILESDENSKGINSIEEITESNPMVEEQIIKSDEVIEEIPQNLTKVEETIIKNNEIIEEIPQNLTKVEETIENKKIIEEIPQNLTKVEETMIESEKIINEISPNDPIVKDAIVENKEVIDEISQNDVAMEEEIVKSKEVTKEISKTEIEEKLDTSNQIVESTTQPVSEDLHMPEILGDNVSTADENIVSASDENINTESKLETQETIENEINEDASCTPSDMINADIVTHETDIEKSAENNIDSNTVTENDEICADTPPHMLDQESAILYEDEPVVHNEADGNSLPDHVCDESNVSCSSESAALPDSTSPNIEITPHTPNPAPDNMFSDSSSDASAEIPIQPPILVSQHLVQNFSSMLNNSTGEEKSNDADGETPKSTDEPLEKNIDSPLSEEFEVGNER